MVQTLFKKQWFYIGLEILSALLLISFILKYTLLKGGGSTPSMIQNYSVGLLLAFTVFKLFVVAFLLPEDLFRLGYGIYNKLFSPKHEFTWISRRKFISQTAMGVAAIPFSALLYGVIFGRYQFRTITHRLYFEDLPTDFDGYRITQISDIHCGSFDNENKVNYAINLINEQNSDLILFTGDIVNNRSEELLRWKSHFSKLNAKDGIFSILGNHDYGDYTSWSSEEAKIKNLDTLKELQKEMGFDLLLNEHRYLYKNKSKIALLGVENWGSGGFIKVGDLDKAKQGIHSDDFKILMSHDPTHWQYKVLEDPDHFHLTLSGHTHGMQFGVEIPGLVKWSPSSWRYKYWAGLYHEKGQFINVNRGLGYIGYPGRFGIWPEITVLELKKGKNPNERS